MANVTRVTNTCSDLHQYLDTHFEHLIAEKGLTYRAQEARTCKPGISVDMVPATFGSKLVDLLFANGYSSTLWLRPDGITYVQLGIAPQNAGVSIEVASDTVQRRTDAIRELKELFPAREIPPDREEVMVAFWSLTSQGARAMERSIAIAPWERVKSNYTPQTQNGLQSLMGNFRPTKAGQLILWYGPPGTGKTHALRALTWEWRKWSTFHYITDPEIFFGGNANYMLDVLLMRDQGNPIDDDEDSGPHPHSTYGPPVVSKGTTKEKKWRLLILEDSGELMVPDAKAQTGQGLSRLLNVVDGLIGQGLRIMVLVTTNEILKKLHPAVARPGRCAARIEFGEFTKTDAGLWLKGNGHDVATKEFGMNTTISLAELYATIGEQQTISESKSLPVGFGS